MPNYGPNTAPGMVRNRIFRVIGENANVLSNPSFIPFMIFEEETAIQLASPAADGATEKSLGSSRTIRLDYSPGKIITTRHPVTDVEGPVGRIPADLTMAEALAVLYSLGRQAQTDQDAQGA